MCKEDLADKFCEFEKEIYLDADLYERFKHWLPFLGEVRKALYDLKNILEEGLY